MNRELLATAVQSIGRVLGEAAFVFAEELDKTNIPDSAAWQPLGIGIQFKGSPSGEVHLWADPGFAEMVAANMLGIETGSVRAGEKAFDSLKEITNMITGNLIIAAYGDSEVFDLGIPTLLDREMLEPDKDDPGALWLNADEHPVLCTITVAEA